MSAGDVMAPRFTPGQIARAKRAFAAGNPIWAIADAMGLAREHRAALAAAVGATQPEPK